MRDSDYGEVYHQEEQSSYSSAWATCINKLPLVARVSITRATKSKTGNKEVVER